MKSANAAHQSNGKPNWHEAAQALINALSVLPDEDDRIELLEDFCDGLGASLYPAFIHTLYQVERTGAHRAHELVSSTLVSCLLSGRLPTGEAAAWGAALQSASDAATGSGFGHQRRLGPVEYLCAWQVQSDTSNTLSTLQFTEALGGILRLLDSDQHAASLYRQHIEQQLSDPVGGAFNQQVRHALQSLVQHWANNVPAHTIAERCLQATNPRSGLEQLIPR